MAIGSKLRAFGAWALGQWERFWAKEENKDEFYETLTNLALVAAEAASGLDLDGDGRTASIALVLDVAVREGVGWGRRFSTDVGRTVLANLDASDLRRWHAVALVTDYVLSRFGPERLPRLARLNFVVELAVNLLDDRDD